MDDALDSYASLAREYLAYDPDTGHVTWIKSPPRHNLAGKRAGNLNRIKGYRFIGFMQRQSLEHRMIFLLVTGRWPVGVVDHINGDKADNRWANLRDVSCSTNSQNERSPRKNNSSGHMGVSRTKGRWRASILAGGKHKTLGLFDDKESAAGAYLAAKRKLHAGCTI